MDSPLDLSRPHITVADYLLRIGIQPSSIRRGSLGTVSLLNWLHWQHMCTVPFENLSVLQGQATPLSMGDILDRIVRDRLGSRCMTANPCFGRLLSKLGFVVRHLLGRVSLPSRGWAKRDDHCLLMVRCTSGGWYLVDIAFGDSSRTPIPLTRPRSEFPDIVEEPSVLDADWIQREANTTDVAGHHYIRNLTEHDEGPGHLLYAVTKDTGRTAPFVLYGFNLERRSWPEDFAEVYDFLIRSPESIFTNVLVCTLALPYGRVSVNAREVVTFDSRTGIRTKSSYHSLEELSFILQTHFGMNMTSFVSGRLVKPLLELSSVALVS